MPWQPRQCVVVPIDFSESAEPAVRDALNLARSPESVYVIHVLPDMDTVSPGAIFGDITDESRREAAEEYMRDFLNKHSIEGVKSAVLIGDPGMEVVAFANANGAELIVVPSHGYHGIRHLLLGSVAERIIRHAHCAVYVPRRHDAR